MILNDYLLVQKTIEMFLTAHKDYVFKVSKKGKLIIEVSANFIDGKYQEKGMAGISEKRLKRIPISTKSVLGQNHS